jgi:hypothetical protein
LKRAGAARSTAKVERPIRPGPCYSAVLPLLLQENAPVPEKNKFRNQLIKNGFSQ